jgi:hypothetical protein
MKLHSASAALLICLSSLIVVIAAVAVTKQQRSGQLANLTDDELKAVVIQFEPSGVMVIAPHTN